MLYIRPLTNDHPANAISDHGNLTFTPDVHNAIKTINRKMMTIHFGLLLLSDNENDS